MIPVAALASVSISLAGAPGRTPAPPWTWTPRPGDEEPLGRVLFARETADRRSVSVELVEDGARIVSTGRCLVLLVPGTFGDVLVEADIEVERLDGGVGVVLHENPSRRWAVFSLEGDRAELVSYRKKARRVLDRVPHERGSGPFTLSIRAVGRALEGGLDGRVMTTGERQPPVEGRVGLFLDGPGSIVVRSLRVRPLPRGD